MALLDQKLIEKYRKIINLMEFVNSGNDTIITANLNMEKLQIDNDGIYNTDLLSLFNINTSNNIFLISNTLYDVNVSGTTNIENDIDIGGTFYCGNNITINNNLQGNNLSVSNYITGLNDLLLNNITSSSISFNTLTSTSLIIDSNVININTNDVNINGTYNTILITNTIFNDSILELNDNNGTATDSGIEIYSISGVGYLKTDNTLDYYLIKYPNNVNINRLLTMDYNYNLNISGQTDIRTFCNIHNNFDCNNLECNNISTISFLSNGTGLCNNIIGTTNFTTTTNFKCNQSSKITETSKVNLNCVIYNDINVENTIKTINFNSKNVTVASNMYIDGGDINLNFTTINNIYTDIVTTNTIICNNANTYDCIGNNTTVLSDINTNNFININISCNSLLVNNNYNNYGFIGNATPSQKTMTLYGIIVLNNLIDYQYASTAVSTLGESRFYKTGNILKYSTNS